MKNLHGRITSLLQGNKIEIFNHGNILEGHSSVVWDSKKKGQIIKHFETNKNPQSILIKNFNEDKQSLEQLLKSPTLKGIVSLDGMTKEDFINNLVNLEVFICLEKMHFKIDLKRLTRIRILSTVGRNVENINYAHNLERLHIDQVKIDFDISKSHTLNELSIHFGDIKNLDCIKDTKNLKKIEFRNLNALISLEGLNEKHTQLESLEIFSAKKLINLENIAHLKNLKTLYLQRIPDIPNLKFLRELKNLNRLILGCEVKELNPTYIKHIKEIFIPNYDGNTI